MPKRICQVCATPIPSGSRCVKHRTTRSGRSTRGSTRKWRALRLRILRRDGYRCAYCGGEATTVDHLIPKKRGGTDAPSNLAAACSKCNYSKRELTPEEWKATR